jgi:hypothetical protein
MTQPRISTEAICEHFGLKMTISFIEDTLKVPARESEKRARYWYPEDLPKIGKAAAAYFLVKSGEHSASISVLEQQVAGTSVLAAGAAEVDPFAGATAVAEVDPFAAQAAVVDPFA